MSKKIVAMLMAVAMAFSLLPVTAFAAGGPQEGNSQPVTESKNNLTMNKTVTSNGDGTYTVHLESYATGSVIPTQAPVPMDIVLVLDVSGSMTGEIASYTYQATNQTSWSVSDVYNAYYQKNDWGIRQRTDVTYYAKIGDEYYTVSYQSKWNWGQGYREYWLEANNQVLGEKVTGSTWEKVVYDKALYTRETDPNKTTTKLEAMKTAVNNFITTVAAQKNGDTPVAHRISIVKFAGNSKDEVGNHKYNNNKYNYTQKVTELTDVTNDGSVASLKKAVNDLTAGGATAADWGMQKAKDVLTKRDNKENPSIVIMFTDGEPNHGNDYDKAVAGDTVDTAKTLKAGGTKVYTIGMFKDLQPSNADKVDTYMNGVSSNYPEAVKADNDSGVTLGTRAEGSNYYFKADNAGALDQVFQTISESTTVTSPLDDEAVVVDNVPSNFALTEGSVNEGSVKVYTANCTAKNDDTFEWSRKTESTSIKPKIENQSISVTGFNFSENWCGLDGTTPRGKKLIIEFTIKCTNYGGTQPTNAGAYIKAGKEADEKPIISLKDPTVPVTIELNKTLGVNDEKPYDGEGFAILTKIAAQANTLVDGLNNAYVDMALTVTVGNDIYTYKIPAKATTGSWYQGNSTSPMSDGAIGGIKTSKDVKRSTSNEVDVYTCNFDLTLSDAAPNGAAALAEYKNNTASFKITPRDVTVTAKDKSVVAGQLAPTYEADVTGTINSDTVKYTIFCDYAPGATGTEFNITPKGEDVQGNYNVTYRPGKLTVVAAPTGTLKVTKEVQGENLTLDNLSDEFAITVTDDQGSAPTTLKLTDNNVEKDTSNTTATWTISNLAPGTYTVSETGETLENYTCEATYHADTASDATVTVNNTAQNQLATDAQASQKVTVTAGSTRTMTVTNTYTRNATVNLSQLIQKQLTVKKNSTLPDNTKFTVTVTPTTTGDQGTQTAITGTTTNTWENGTTDTTTGDTTYTAPFNFTSSLSLPAGTYTYTVQENATSPISGMQYDSDTYTLTIEVKNSTATVKYTTKESTTPTEVSTTKPLTIKNTYQAPALTVTKQTVSVAGKPFDSNSVAHVNDQIIWSVTVTNKNSTPARVTLTDAMAEGVYTKQDCKEENKVTLTSGNSWTAIVSGEVTYYVTYTVKADDISKGKIVNTIVMKNGDEEKTANSEPVSTWDTKQLKSATSLNDWTTTVTLTLPTVNGKEEGTPVITSDAGQGTEVKPDPIAVKSGSYVIDQIGNEFTFVPELTLKVGKNEYTGVKDGDTNTYNFGTETGGAYPYTVTYDATKTPAQFTWNINENVYAGTKVTLSYKLKLTTPKTAAGTYGVEDLNGNGQIEQGKTPIYTNESAALYKDDKTKLAEFPKPSVSYTVSSGSSGSHSGGSRPSLNTKDHYGYIIGYPVDYYTGQPTTDQTKKPVRPEGKITRAEVATIYFRMLTDESRTKFWSQSNSYSDVKTGDWFNNAVSTLSNAGIIAGYEDGSFRPNGYITRAEFATIAARFFDVTYNGKDLFPDISGHWAKDYINQAANKGFVNGYEDGTFKPDRNITRAEAVTLVNRTLDRHPDKSHFTKDMLVWPDNMDQTKWYYADMQEATNSHTYQMKENSDKTKYENWTKTLPIRNWEALEKAWSNANSSQGNGNVV